VDLPSGRPPPTIDGLGAASLKKLELARALATQPKLLLADESLNGLDHSEMDQAADMLGAGSRKEKGITIVWVEHIMGVLMRVVDRVVVLDHGEKIFDGAPQWHNPIRASSSLSRGGCGMMLELKSIDVGYGGFQALFDVTMNVEAGEAVAVIGSNGAGKTTLLRVISGLLAPTAGAMTMEGVDLIATAPHKIIETGIAHVPEGRRLFPRLSVEDNLRMALSSPPRGKRFAERLDYVYGLFPRLRSGAPSSPAPCPAASSRCVPSRARS